MADINDLINNLEEFQDIKFKDSMEITQDLQTKQLEALNNINESLKDLKTSLGGDSSGGNGNSGGFFDDLLRSIFGNGTGGGNGGNSGGLGDLSGGIDGILNSIKVALLRTLPGKVLFAVTEVGKLLWKGIMANPFFTIAKGIAKGFKKIVEKGAELVSEGISYAFDKIKSIPGTLWNYGRAGISKAIDVAKNLASSAASGVKNVLSTLVSTISSGLKSLVNMAIGTMKELVIQPMIEGADAYIETTNKIRKEVGWQKGDYEQFAGSMSRMIGELGNKVGASDVLKQAHEVVQLGIKDEEAVSAYTKTLMKMQLALDIDASGMKNLLELTKRLGAQGAQAIEKLGKSIRALDDANLVKALGNKDLMAFAEKMSDVFGGNAEEGSDEWLKENQWAMSGYNTLANIDPNLAKGLGEFMTKVANARNTELGDLSVQFGMDMSSVRDAIDRGDIQSVMNSYLAGVNRYISGGLWNSTSEAQAGFANIFSRSQAKRMQRLMNEGKFNALQASQDIETGYLAQVAGANSDEDNLDKSIQGQNVGIVKEMQNANSALGIHMGEIMRESGANAKDVSWAVNKLTEMVTLGFDMVQSLVGSVISGVKGVFDVLVPAPVQTALAIAGVMYIGYRVFGDYLMKATKGLLSYVTDAMIGLGNFILDALPGAMQLAMDVLVGVGNFLIDALPGMFNLLKDAVMGLGRYIIDSLPGVFNLVVDALTGLGSYLKDALTGLGNFILDALPGTLYFLKDVIVGLGYFAKDFTIASFDYLRDALKGSFKYLFDLLPGLFDFAIEAGGQFVHWLWDSLAVLLPAVGKALGDFVWEGLKAVGQIVGEGLPVLGELVVEALKSLGKFIGGWIEVGVDILINKGKEVLISGLEYVGELFDGLGDSIIDVINKLSGFLGFDLIDKENPEERKKKRHESLIETFGVKSEEELKPPTFEEVFDRDAYSEIFHKFGDVAKKQLEIRADQFMKPLDDIGEVLNDIPDIGKYVTADFSQHATKYLKKDANGNVMGITDYIGEATNGSLLDYFNRQSGGKNPLDYIKEQLQGRSLKDYIEEHGGSTDINSYIDQQTGGKNVFDYLKENIGDLSNYLTANGNIMDYLRESVDDLNSYITTNGNVLDYISEKLKGSPMDYFTANGTPFDYINRQTGGKSLDDYIPDMDKQQVMANLKSVMGDIGNFVQEGLGEALNLIGVEHGDEIAKQGMDFMKNLFDKATAGASQLMESGQNLLNQVDLSKLMNSAGDIGSLLTNTLSSGLSPLAGGLESLLSNFQNFNQASGAFQRDELSASKATAHSVADIAKSINPSYAPPAYEEGTPLVGSGQTFDSNAQVAVLHEGEAVVPADQNPYNNPTSSNTVLTGSASVPELGTTPRSQLMKAHRVAISGVKGNSGNPLDREAIKDVEGAVRDSTNLEMQNANINADRDSQLQGVQIGQGKKNEEQHNVEIKQGVEGLEQGKSMIKQGEEDKVIQTKITEQQDAFSKLFKEFYDDWKKDKDSDNAFYADTLANLMGIHNNTGGIAMILMQVGSRLGGGNQSPVPGNNSNVTPLAAPGNNASLDQKADYVYSELIRNGFSKDVAAGIVGNLMNENLAEHDQSHADYHGDGSYAGMGGGMAAWLNERFTGLQDFAKSQGKDWKDLGVQTQFLLKELEGMPSLKQKLLSGNLSVDDAANLFMSEFERPAAQYAHLDRRISSAKEVRQRDNHAITAPVNVGGGGGGDLSALAGGSRNQSLTTGNSPTNNTNILTPSPTNGNIPHYKQWEWQSAGWNGSTGNMQNTGCNPTSLAIALSQWTGKEITPTQVADYLSSQGINGGSFGNTQIAGSHWGVQTKSVSHDQATEQDYAQAYAMLQRGIPVMLGVDRNLGASSDLGHYLVAQGIDSSGKVIFNNPGRNDAYGGYEAKFTWDEIKKYGADLHMLSSVPTNIPTQNSGSPSMANFRRMDNGDAPVNTPVNQQALAGGNTLRMMAQVGKECTKEAWAAITNAYLGTNYTAADIDFSGANGWATTLENGQLQAQVYDYGQGDRAAFEQQIQSHFAANPNRPIYLYQAGGAGSGGSHPVNRGSGTHASVIGRRLENGKYQVFDSNGFDNNGEAKVQELDLSQIWDASARGGSGIRGNALWIPQIAPTKEITQWETNKGAVPGSTGQQGGSPQNVPQPQQSGQPLNLGGFQPSFAGQSTFSGISASNFSPANVTGGGADYQSQVISLLRGIARALGVDTRAITGAIVQSSNNQGAQLVSAINENGIGSLAVQGNNPQVNSQNNPQGTNLLQTGGTVDINSVLDRNVTLDSGVTAETLDQLFKGGIMEGMGKDFIEIGRKYGIDPAFLAAITKSENNYGHDLSGILGHEGSKHNVMSILDENHNPEKYDMGSIRGNVEEMAKQLKKYYIEGDKNGYDKRDTTRLIQTIYCPDGSEGGEGWLANIPRAYAEMIQIQGSLNGANMQPINSNNVQPLPNANVTPQSLTNVLNTRPIEKDFHGLDEKYINLEHVRADINRTDIRGLQPIVKQVFNEMAKDYYQATGKKLYVTGAAEGTEYGHAGGEGSHPEGWKIDLAIDADRNILKQLGEKYGVAIGDESNHYDLQFKSKGVGVGGTRITSNAMGKYENGNATLTPQQQNLNQANQPTNQTNQPTQQGQQAIDLAKRNQQNQQQQQLTALQQMMKVTGLTSSGLTKAVEYIRNTLKRDSKKLGSNGLEFTENDIKYLTDVKGLSLDKALETLKKEKKYTEFSEDMLKQAVYKSGEKMNQEHIKELIKLGFTFQEAIDTLKLAKGEEISPRQQVEEFIKGTGLSKEFLEKNAQNIIKANNRDLKLLGENGIEIDDNDLKYALSLDWIKGDMDKAIAFLKADAKYNEITTDMIEKLTTKDGKHLKIEDLKSLTKMGYTLKEAVDILENPEELKKLQDKEGKGNSVAELANSGKSNAPEKDSSPFRVDSEALIQKYMIRDRMVFGSFGQTLASRKNLGNWIVQNKGELPPGYRQWSNPLSRAGMPHLLYGQIQPGVIPTNTPSSSITRDNRGIYYRNGIPISTPPFVSPQSNNQIDTRYNPNSNIYRPNTTYEALKGNFKSGIDKILTVELGYKSVRDLQEASKNLKISSKNLDKSTDNMDEALTDITAPSGQKYTQNDFDYLTKVKGYTKEKAIEELSKDIKYKKLDLSKVGKSKNEKEFDQEDVRDLLLKNRDNKDYTIDKAIEELNKSDKYSKPLEDLAKLEKEIKERISSGESKDDELGKIIVEIKKANTNELRQLSVKYGIDTKAIKESIEKATNKGQQTSREDTLENRNKLLKEVVDKLSPRELAMKYGLTREEIEALQIKYKGKSEIPDNFVDPIGNKVRQITSSARISKTGELMVRPQDYHMTLTAGQRRQLQSEIVSYRDWEAKQVQEKASKFTDGKISYEDYMKTRLERLSRSRQGIPFQVGLDNQSLQSLDKASKRIKESSDSMDKSATKIEEGSGKMSEAGIEFSKNDMDYLTKVKGFTEEQAIAMLNKDAKYMKIDTSNLEKAINTRQFDSADIRKLLVEHKGDKDYSIDKAIKELNQTAKYSKSLDDINKLGKDLKERIASGENKDDELGKIVQEIKDTKVSDLSNLSLKYGIETSELESFKKSLTPTTPKDTNQGNVNLTRDDRGVYYSNGLPVSTPPFVSPQINRLSPEYYIYNGGFTGGYRRPQGMGIPPMFGGIGGGFNPQYQQGGNLAQTLHPFKTLIQTFFGKDYKKGNESFAVGAQNFRDAVWSGDNFEGNIYSDKKSGVDWMNILMNTGTGSIGREKRRDIWTSTGGIGNHAYQFDQNSFMGMMIGGFNQRQAEQGRGWYLTPGQDNVISSGYSQYQQQYYPQAYQSYQPYQQSYYQYPQYSQQMQRMGYSSVSVRGITQQRMIPQKDTYEYYMDKASRATGASFFKHSKEYWLKKAEEAKAMGRIMNPEVLEKQSIKATKTSKESKSADKEKANEDIIKFSSGKEYSKNDIAYLKQFDWIKSDEDAMKYLDNNSWKYKDVDWSKQGLTVKDNKLFTKDNKEINEKDLRKALDMKEINGDMTKALEYLSEQAKKAGDNLGDTGDKIEETNKQLDKDNKKGQLDELSIKESSKPKSPYEGSGVNMDFSTWKGGEYFNDRYAVSDKTKSFLKGELSKEELMKELGIKNTSDILTAEQQQQLGFREFNKIRTFKNFEVDSQLWKQGGNTDTAVEQWLKAHPEAQVKRNDLDKLEIKDKNSSDKEDKFKDIEDINKLYKDGFERIEGDLSKINPDTFKEERDKLGNITNLPGMLKDNIITGEETLSVRKAKKDAQDREKEKILSDIREFNKKKLEGKSAEKEIKASSEITPFDKSREDALNQSKEDREKYRRISEDTQNRLEEQRRRILPNYGNQSLDGIPLGDLTVGGGFGGAIGQGFPRSKPSIYGNIFGGGLMSGIGGVFNGGNSRRESPYIKGTYEYYKSKADKTPEQGDFLNHSKAYWERMAEAAKMQGRVMNPDILKPKKDSKSIELEKPKTNAEEKKEEILTFGKNKQYKKEHIDYLLAQSWIKNEDEAKKYLDANSWQYKDVDWTKQGLTVKDDKLFTSEGKEISEKDLRITMDREDIKGDIKKALEYLSSQEKLSQELVDETKNTNSTLEDQVKDAGKAEDVYKGSGINMDFSTWKGGEYFNDKYAVDDATKAFMKGELSKEDLMKKLGITDPEAILTAEQQQKLGFREFNKIRTFKNFEVDSDLWKSQGTETSVEQWLKANPNSQVKRTDLDKLKTLEEEANKTAKVEEKPKTEIGEAAYAEYKKPEKGTYEYYMEKAENAPEYADTGLFGMFGKHSKQYWLEKALKTKERESQLDKSISTKDIIDSKDKAIENVSENTELINKEEEKEEQLVKATRDNIKIDGKSYEESLKELEKMHDEKYGIDALTGNLTGLEIPDELKINKDDSKEVKDAKFAKQQELQQKEVSLDLKNLDDKYDAQASMFNYINERPELQKSIQAAIDKGITPDIIPEFDKNGNIINIPGMLEDNIYNPETDDLGVRDAKFKAQNQQYAEILEGIRTKQSVELMNQDKEKAIKDSSTKPKETNQINQEKNLEKVKINPEESKPIVSDKSKPITEPITEPESKHQVEIPQEQNKKFEKGTYEYYMDKAGKVPEKGDFFHHSKQYWVDKANEVKLKEDEQKKLLDKSETISIIDDKAAVMELDKKETTPLGSKGNVLENTNKDIFDSLEGQKEFDNIEGIDIPGYNIIDKKNDSITVQREKYRKQLEQLSTPTDEEINKAIEEGFNSSKKSDVSIDEEIKDSILSEEEKAKTSSKLKFDEFGNITNINIPEYNKVTTEDDMLVTKAKWDAQDEQMINEILNKPSEKLVENNKESQLEDVSKEPLSLTESGDIPGIDIPDYNKIDLENDTLNVQDAKFDTQIDQLIDETLRKGSNKSIEDTKETTLAEVESHQPLQLTEEGNLPGLDIPDYNKVDLKNNTLEVQDAKLQAQTDQMIDEILSGKSKEKLLETPKIDEKTIAENKLENLKKRIGVPDEDKLNELEKSSRDIEKSAKEEISKYDIEGDTARMTKEQESQMLDDLAKETKLETITSSTQEEVINPKKGTYDYYMKKAEEAPDKANMGFFGTGLFGEHSKEYWLKKAEKVKNNEGTIQEEQLTEIKEKSDDTNQLDNRYLEESVKESSGITKDDIKIDGKTYEESLTDLNKELDSRYGIDALTGNLTGFDIPEEYKLTGSETKKEKAMKIEKQNELMAKDQELAYKELDDKYTGQAEMLEEINNNPELAKSIEEAEKAGINPDTFKPEFDENLNITNLPGMLKDNIYNPETDDLGVRDAKFKAQNEQAAEILEGLKTKQSVELIDKDKKVEESIEGKSSQELSDKGIEKSIKPKISQSNPQETVIGEGVSKEIKKPEKGSYDWWMEKADKAKNKEDMSFWDKLTGHHSKEYYLEQAEKVKLKDSSKEGITPDKEAESSVKPETSQENAVMSPRGIPYEQNDIDYLLNNGYTPEAAYEELARHPKYMKIDMSKVSKAPNGKEFEENDIRRLLMNGYSMEDAINFLSKDKKYALDGTSKQEQVTQDIGEAAKETEAKAEASKSTSIQDTTGETKSGEIEETIKSSETPSGEQSGSLDVGGMATQAETAKTQATQASSDISESSSNADIVKWAVGRIESKLDAVITAIQNNGGNKSVINNDYSNQGNSSSQNNDIILKPSDNTTFYNA